MPGASTNFPTSLDSFADGAYDPAIADAVNALESAVGVAARAPSTPAFASGTAVQNTAKYSQTFAIATATAGSATIDVGPTSTPAIVLVTGKVLAATDLLAVTVPAGWYVKITLTTSTGAADWNVY